MKNSRGRYIARLDADDIALPDRLEKQLIFMEENKNIALAGSWVEKIDETGKIITQRKSDTDLATIKFNFIFGKPSIYHSAIFFRKDTIMTAGGYNNECKYSQDFDLYVRLINTGALLAIVPKVLIQSRLHNQRISKNSQDLQHKYYLKILYNLVNKNYTNISWSDWLIRDKVKSYKKHNLSELTKAIKINNKIWKNFLRREKMDNETINRLKNKFKKQIKLYITRYIKSQIIGVLWKKNMNK